jgi:hypothetical protein
MFCVLFVCKCVLPPGVNQMCTATGCQPNCSWQIYQLQLLWGFPFFSPSLAASLHPFLPLSSLFTTISNLPSLFPCLFSCCKPTTSYPQFRNPKSSENRKFWHSPLILSTSLFLQYINKQHKQHCDAIYRLYLSHLGTADGGTVVKVLRYKSEGRSFDSRWCHLNFSLT